MRIEVWKLLGSKPPICLSYVAEYDAWNVPELSKKLTLNDIASLPNAAMRLSMAKNLPEVRYEAKPTVAMPLIAASWVELVTNLSPDTVTIALEPSAA